MEITNFRSQNQLSLALDRRTREFRNILYCKLSAEDTPLPCPLLFQESHSLFFPAVFVSPFFELILFPCFTFVQLIPFGLRQVVPLINSGF